MCGANRYLAVSPISSLKHRDEHRRNILQKIFRLRVLENFRVLLQFVRDLVNDETAASRERVMRLPEQGAFLVDLKNTEGNSGHDVIAGVDPTAMQFTVQMCRIIVDHVHARIVAELPPEIARKSGINFKQEQLTILTHPARDLAGMHAFTWPVFGDHAGLFEINLVRDAFNQRFRARHDRGDLKWTFQESLEEKGAHRKTNSHPLSQQCPVTSAGRG